MGDALEIELKLEFDPADRMLLEDSDLFDSARRATDRLVSAYFDTPEQDLREAGYSLRIRRKGKQRIQTVKADNAGAGGLFIRPEWEREVDGEEPVLDATSGPLAQIVDGATLARLDRLFETDVTRTTRALTVEGATLELAVDEGEVRAGHAREPLCEIELELGSGSPRALFDFARKLGERVPLRLGVRSKSERGYRLADGERDDSMKAEPVILDRDGDAREAFVAIAHNCLRQFRINEALLMKSGGIGAVHQARVGLRRLRSAFSLFKPLLEGDEKARLLRAELKWLAAELGEVRNLDVLIPRMDEEVGEQLAVAREVRLAQARTELHSARTRLLMIDLAEWLAIGAWRTDPADIALAARPAAAFASDLLDRQRRKIKRDGKGLADLDDDHRHEVRIDAKKLRYATEFFGSLYTGKKARRRHKSFLSALEELQDHLGELNDQVTGPKVLEELGIDARLPLPGKRERARVLDRAEDAYDMLVDAKRFWR